MKGPQKLLRVLIELSLRGDSPDQSASVSSREEGIGNGTSARGGGCLQRGARGAEHDAEVTGEASEIVVEGLIREKDGE